LYVATGGGHIYALEPVASPPAGNFRISVSVTETQFGPDICISGEGFTPKNVAQIIYSNIPGRTAPISLPLVGVRADTTFHETDTSQEMHLVACSGTQITQDVSIEAIDIHRNEITFGTVPGAYWCENATVSTNLNGGCH
jgi:hypothetical protein